MSLSPRTDGYYFQLHEIERHLLTPKLANSLSAGNREQDEHDLLHELIHVPEDERLSAAKIQTLRNFIRQVSTMPQAWEQVTTIVGVAVSYLEIRVHDCDSFLQILRTHKYAVNSWMERVSRLVGQGHRFDSARALTEHRHDPQLHFVNDRADEDHYGPNYFFVHWDAQSVYAKRGSLIGRIVAGRTHKHSCASPQQVEAYLNRVLTCQNG